MSGCEDIVKWPQAFLVRSGIILIAILAIFITGRLGLLIPYFNSNISLFWLPTGIGVAAVFLAGSQMLVAVFLGSLLTNIVQGSSVIVSLGIGCGSTFAIFVTVYLLRVLEFRKKMTRTRDVISLFLAGAVGMTFSATIGVASLFFGGVIPESSTVPGFFTWWMGDFEGVLLGVPLILSFSKGNIKEIQERLPEFLLTVIVSILITLRVSALSNDVLFCSLAFLTIAWTAFRFNQLGAAGIILFLSGMVTLSATGANSHFSGSEHGVFVLWTFMSSMSIFGLTLTAIQASKQINFTQLKLREQELRTVFQTMNDGLVVQDSQGKIVQFNDAALELLGLSSDQLLGRTSMDPRWQSIKEDGNSFPGEEHPAMLALKTGKKILDVRMGIKLPDGRTRWLKFNAAPFESEIFDDLPGETRRRVIATFSDITNEKIALEKLVESKEKWQSLFSLLPVGVTILDSAGKIVESNAALKEILALQDNSIASGAFRERFYWKSDGTIFKPDEFPSSIALREQKRSGPTEIGVTLENGTRLWTEVMAAPLPWKDEACVLVTQNITERVTFMKELKRRQDIILSNKNQLDVVSNLMPGAVSSFDLNGRFTFANEMFRKWFGRSNEQVQGKTLQEILPAEIFRMMDVYVNRAIKGVRISFEAEIVTVEGMVSTYVTLVPEFDSNQTVLGIIAFAMDVTELKKSERELAIERRKFESLGNGLSESTIVAVTDIWGRITFANDQFCNITGYDRTELLGQNHRILNSGYHDKEFFKKMWEDISKGIHWKGEIRNRRKDGSFYWVDTSISKIKGSNGEDQFLAIRYDITGRKDAELKLIQSAKLASLGEMSAGIAHEINNPLAIISGTANALLRVSNDTEKLTAKIDIIRSSCERIVKIVRGLKKFSRTDVLVERKNHSMVAIISEGINMTHYRFVNGGVTLINECQIDETVFCDDVAIEQVFINLLGNSVDALKKLPEKWVKITSSTDENSILIRICDSGYGLPLNIKEKIFEPFFTTKPPGEGTGLGLSISKGIVEDHGGTLTIDENSPNTCFIVKLPLSKS